LDVSDKESRFVILDRHGQVIQEGSVRTTPAALSKQFAGEARRIAIETGAHSPWISRLLLELGHEVLVANSRQVALISRNQRKTDRLDALRLARLARIDPQLLHPVTHRSQKAQEHLALLRSREQLVSARTALVNHVRCVVKSVGGRLPTCSAPSFHRKVANSIPAGLRLALEPVLATIKELTAREQAMYKQVARLLEETYPAARALMAQIHGVGPLTALAFVLTLEEPSRFQKSRDVGAYLGLTRRQRDSGESTPQLHITKAGDAFLRRLMVQCAHYILGPFGRDSSLRRWGLALVAKVGRKRAIIAVARKLAVLMHSLWSSGEVYEPMRGARELAAA
jgi:transposase